MYLPEGARLGRYTITALIGEGGMGEVYLAEDTTLERRVALKILPPALARDGERMARFVREAKAASALNHPHIAHVYEIGEGRGVNGRGRAALKDVPAPGRRPDGLQRVALDGGRPRDRLRLHG